MDLALLRSPHRRHGHQRSVLAAAALALAALVGCGSKTGLLVPDRDAGEEEDAGICVRTRSPLEQRTPEILFVLDSSRSMQSNLAGEPAEPGETRRWDLLGDALLGALEDREDELGFGVLLFPRAPDPIRRIEEACQVGTSLDIPIRPANLSRLEELFEEEDPIGGTPTAAALRAARRRIGDPTPGVQRFVVLATDGAPNCNSEPPIPPPACICTSDDPEVCVDPELGPYQCLDDAAAVEAVATLNSDDGVPVYVIGINDPRRPEFGATLDAMAVAGGRPRPAGGRRFYDIRRPNDLDQALETITASIEACLYYLTGDLDPEEVQEITLNGVPLPRDPGQSDGWDLTNVRAGEISLFGATCNRVAAADGVLTALTGCP